MPAPLPPVTPVPPQHPLDPSVPQPELVPLEAVRAKMQATIPQATLDKLYR